MKFNLKFVLNAAFVGAVLFIIPLGSLAQGPPNAPFAGASNMTCGQALKQVIKSDDPSIAKLGKTYEEGAAKLKKSPKDAKVKKAFVTAAVAFEQKIVRGANKISPPIKYRAGLALCRQVLAIDPKNPECKRDLDETVDIYKSMNRPVPQ